MARGLQSDAAIPKSILNILRKITHKPTLVSNAISEIHSPEIYSYAGSIRRQMKISITMLFVVGVIEGNLDVCGRERADGVEQIHTTECHVHVKAVNWM